jgi:hypothetical protein
VTRASRSPSSLVHSRSSFLTSKLPLI